MVNKKIVLAIDDNEMQLEIFEKMLSKKFDIRPAKSASDAIYYLNRNPADIILLDIEMPNINGFEFLYDIRKIPRFRKVPKIIVSGKTGQDFFNEARNSSAFEVLSKPVKLEKLVETIEKALAAMG